MKTKLKSKQTNLEQSAIKYIPYELSYTEITLILFFTLISTIYILTGAHADITGNHIWRQADVYGHILGFMDYKNFQVFDRFIIDQKAVYDIPIYQWIIAKVSLATRLDPLVVTNVLGYFLWIITAVSGYMISNILGKQFAGLSFLFFLSTSSLILHYYSVPLPDTLSIALALLAILILLHYKLGYKSILFATPFFVVATLIKSPIVFILVLFYLLFILFAHQSTTPSPPKTSIKKNLPLFLLIVILLISVITAELLRKHLMGGIDGLGFAQDPLWYFGSLELRTQAIFWHTLLSHLDNSGIYPFSIVYIVTILFSFFAHRDRNLVAVVFSAILTFLAGWLIFSNLYLQHDYYKLPATVVLFVSLSVSVSYIIDYLYTKYINDMHLSRAIVVPLIAIATLFILFTQDFISHRGQTGITTKTKDILKPYNMFVDITNRNGDNPSLGGQLGTKYMMMDADTFSNNCLTNILHYGAIVAPKNNQCLQQNKYLFNNIVELDPFRVLYTLDPSEATLLLVQKTEPYLKSDWNIYTNKKFIALYKSPCTTEEANRIFLFRVLPKGGKSDEFAMMDFRFDGIHRDNFCFVFKNLPSYDIDTIAIGQYSFDRSTNQAIKHWIETIDTTK